MARWLSEKFNINFAKEAIYINYTLSVVTYTISYIFDQLKRCREVQSTGLSISLKHVLA